MTTDQKYNLAMRYLDKIDEILEMKAKDKYHKLEYYYQQAKKIVDNFYEDDKNVLTYDKVKM